MIGGYTIWESKERTCRHDNFEKIGVSMRVKSVIILAVAVSAVSVSLAAPVSATEPRRNNKLCGVKESGFTFEQGQDGASSQVSVGVVIQNRTKKTAMQIDSFINLYAPDGSLVKTVKDIIGIDYLTPRDSVKAGETLNVDREVSRISTTVVCAEQSRFGNQNQGKTLLSRQSFTGTAAASPSGDESYLSGTFTNSGKRKNYNGTPTFVLRNASGVIIGGGNMSTGEFGSVPTGLTVTWGAGLPVKFPLGTSVEGTVGYWGNMYS